ncbi:MAG: SUMF1/EgtB/PvdO family nonheme iron enzyme [Bryobacterales bacterium]|nr:SUMF1/EgtB/PvdO family nonheme iron enzyme [Bryobacterales bacterium]
MRIRRLVLSVALSGALLWGWRGNAQEMLRVEASQQPLTDSITGLPLTVQTDAFLLGRTELTQAEFDRVMGGNPSRFRGPDRPVENVSWKQALAYCNRRSDAEGLTRCYGPDDSWDRFCTGYRLPTEVEWRAAAGEAEVLPQALLAGANLYDGETSVAAIATRAAQGTRPVGSEHPDPMNRFAGLAGNVWEMCFDRFSEKPIVDSVWNPAGPQTGVARVIRGGSFLTQATRWNKGFRSSVPPIAASPYVGFRIARSLPIAERSVKSHEVAGIQPVRSTEPAAKPDRVKISEQWMNVLGRPPQPGRSARAILTGTLVEPAWSAREFELLCEPGSPWRALLVLPAHERTERLPVLIVPYYDVDTPAGKNLGGRIATPAGVRAFAHVAAQFGMAALAVRWSGENDGPGYLEVVAGLAQRYPNVTGLGHWIWQAEQTIDWLSGQPEIDPARIGIIGHSLGGKMALYAAAFEPRIRAVVSSEPGISLGFSNYEDPWYLGERIQMLPKGADQHELIQLIAPRPFLLIAGESADGDKSVPILAKAAPAYAASGKPDALGIFNHRSGHSPTPESVVSAMGWLHEQLSKP